MKRLRYVLRRLLQAVPVVLGVVVLNFLLLQLAPGDAATVLAGEAGGAPLEYMQQLRARFGLDQPVLVQLALYVKNILSLDLGYSFRNASPVLPLILAPAVADVAADGHDAGRSRSAVGVLLGLLAAVWVRTWRDNVISVFAIDRLRHAAVLDRPDADPGVLHPARLAADLAAWRTLAAFYEGWERVVDIARHLVLPAVTLSLFYMALYARLMRATMLEQRGLDYVTTARAKGLTERQITLRHMRAQRDAAGGDGGGRAGRRTARRLGGGGDRCSAGRASASSPSSRCSRATSTCCSASSSSRPAWWWW